MTTWEGERRVGEKCQAERREAHKLTAWCGMNVVCSSGSLQCVQSGQTWSNWLKIHFRGLDEWSCCKKQGGSLPGGIEEVEPGQVFHIRYQLKWGWAAPQLPREHQDLCIGHSCSNSNCTSRFFPLLNIFFLVIIHEYFIVTPTVPIVMIFSGSLTTPHSLLFLGSYICCSICLKHFSSCSVTH